MKCIYCGVKLYRSNSEPTVYNKSRDHMIPKCKIKGDGKLDGNLVDCCTRCNRDKGNVDMDVFVVINIYMFIKTFKFKYLKIALSAISLIPRVRKIKKKNRKKLRKRLDL